MKHLSLLTGRALRPLEAGTLARVLTACIAAVTAHLAGACAPLAKIEVTQANAEVGQALATSRSRITDPEVERYFAQMGQIVLAAGQKVAGVGQPGFVPDKQLDIYDRFQVYPHHDVNPNAFVMGDDWTGINSALIVQVERAEELVMVLGHEFGHLYNQHMVEKFMRIQLGRVAGVIAGELAARDVRHLPKHQEQAAADEAARAMMAICNPHTPDAEHESDATGVAIMVELGLDLNYADDLFERWYKLYGDPPQVTSHPRSSERARRVRELAAQYAAQGYTPTRTLDHAAFVSMQSRVKELVRQGVADGSIVYFMREMQQRGGLSELACPMGCGPLYADPKQATQNFFKAAGVN